MDYIGYRPSEFIDSGDAAEYEMELEPTTFKSGNTKMIECSETPQNKAAQKTKITKNTTRKTKTTLLNQAIKYKKYDENQIRQFIYVMQERGLSVPKAAALTGIPRSTGYALLNEFNAGDGSFLPGNNPRKKVCTPKKLFSQHSAFLIELFNENPSTVLEEARSKLCEAFSGLEISLSALHKHIIKKCGLTLKQATKYTADRDVSQDCQTSFQY